MADDLLFIQNVQYYKFSAENVSFRHVLDFKFKLKLPLLGNPLTQVSSYCISPTRLRLVPQIFRAIYIEQRSLANAPIPFYIFFASLWYCFVKCCQNCLSISLFCLSRFLFWFMSCQNVVLQIYDCFQEGDVPYWTLFCLSDIPNCIFIINYFFVITSSLVLSFFLILKTECSIVFWVTLTYKIFLFNIHVSHP